MYELRHNNEPVIECRETNRPVRILSRSDAFRVAKNYSLSLWHFEQATRSVREPRPGIIAYAHLCLSGTVLIGYGVSLVKIG